ncbi:MAG: DUF883 C-terminal domain-containing protein [Bosea sp. (in: a-proteobacteria)]|uniref:DUF883 C-terminal domain-containing protein n=1 Tax=Bosea sp. (in: a-proteobacteria) TaxID=1871050 RepID=UPI0027336C4E|nr:DUF883 C-terminal domain-containing protein [Bosea sp. (in: a-proteobacteria)]MDP3257453.1 DUF883 C-terminal domain-containing protein [Bosea sp. (in: a-proteobacteria)]MDP3318499.1 DUF883 C-terminal domain-containing protein [Bosea sp. (in: a-proteobacteria)]
MATSTTAKRAAASAKRVKDEVVAGGEDIAGEARQAAARVKREAGAIEESLTRGAEDLVATVNEKLRSVGVDTDRMADVAKEQATELQRLIEEEIRERPLRALGLAAAVGLFVGFLSAR